MVRLFPHRLWIAAVLALGLPFLGGCRRQATELDAIAASKVVKRAAAVDDLGYLRGRTIGAPVKGRPWVAHVLPVDLDKDGRLDVVACEAQDSTIVWLRQVERGRFEETVLAEKMRAPVHVEAADIDGDGDLDLLVSSMGEVFPNNDRIGSVIILENDGQQHFTPRWIETGVARVTDLRAADLNGDGKLDLVCGQFGYDQGEIRWLERTGPWTFTPHKLLDLSGTINVEVADFNGDRKPDIVALVSQEWEEVYYFENDGRGNFTKRVVWGSTNEDYASSGLSIADLNRDGKMDVLFTNGDGFGPAMMPGPRPWHGVQWLENNGDATFRFHRIGDLAGAYSPVAVDLDQDGAVDVVAVAAFNEWEKPTAQSLVWFRNDGKMNFTPRVLAYNPIMLLTLGVGDFEGRGRPSIVSGCMHAYPPYEQARMGRIMLWTKAAP
ncbi:FG-GAP repeat domain-containing protein [Nibricoccus sp. IMCC34717]|uniref:FG-GAP repeat domain-containing protein n=1 Tax=Nibricoccus sp. IMCC34717 TaxID=3034021 RepID=UPI00384B2AE5